MCHLGLHYKTGLKRPTAVLQAERIARVTATTLSWTKKEEDEAVKGYVINIASYRATILSNI